MPRPSKEEVAKASENIDTSILKNIEIKSTGKGKYYLTNQDLLPAVIESKTKGFITDKLARMLMLLTDRYSRRSNFSGYSFREDMVSAALTNLCQNALKFDPEKSSNPFAFYTTAIHNSFLQYMIDEKKHRFIRDTLLIDAGCDASYNFMESNKDQNHHDNETPKEEVQTELSDEARVFKEKVVDAKSKKSKKEAKRRIEASMLTF